MNEFRTPAYLVVCYNERGFCRSMHFDSESQARDWAEENSANYTKLVVEKKIGDAWSPDQKRFVIVAWPRTGSTHLARLLNGHSDILCHGEIFQNDITALPIRWPKPDKKVGVIEDLLHMRSLDPSGFLEQVWSRNYACECVGFKIFPGHNDDMLRKLVSDISIRKIVLMRRNILAVYSSAMIARLTGERRRDSRKSGPGWRPAVEFELEQFVQFSANYRQFYRTIFETLQETRQSLHLQLYEHSNDPDQIDRLLRFIGARPTGPLTSRLRKQNSEDILSRFSNPDNVSKFLQEHDLDWSSEVII